MSNTERKIKLFGLSQELAQDIEERVSEFEQKHQDELMRGGPGWVPRIKKIDYAIAIAVNALITLWLVIVLIWF